MIKVFILGSDGTPSGIANYLTNLINFSNSSIKYYVLSKNYGFFKKNIKKKFKFINFDINYNFLNLLLGIIYLKNLIQIYEINIIHAHTQRAAFLCCLVKVLFVNKIKIVYTPHGFRHSQLRIHNKIFHLFIEKFILKKIDHIILITKKELKILKSLKVLEIKKTYIRTSLPKIKFNKTISLRKKFNIDPQKKIILMCGSVQHVKQPQLFLEIAKKTIDLVKDVYFIWIGKKIDNIKKFKNDKIKFIGNIDDKLVYYSLMKSADIFLMTSKLETFPITILEARKLGLSIVCNNFDGAQDLLEKSNFEKKFKYNNSNSAVKILRKLLFKKKKIDKKNQFINDNKFINQLCKKHVYIYNSLK